MPAKYDDLHGNVPDDAAVALLLIDVINDLEFDGGEALLVQALPMATRIAALKRQATQAGIPAVYVNGNFGRWQSNFAKLLAPCLEDGVRGQPLAEQLRPEGDDYFVLKPKHSGFYDTTLDLLLRYLQVTTVILDMYDPKSPWHDQRVRLAANHAIHRQALNEAETLGYSKLLGGLSPRRMTLPCPWSRMRTTRSRRKPCSPRWAIRRGLTPGSSHVMPCMPA
jgi:isochorismatase family protein